MHSESSSAYGALDGAASVFLELRPRLFGIAYRLLGSAAEAEDVVQEVWLRWQTTDRSARIHRVDLGHGGVLKRRDAL